MPLYGKWTANGRQMDGKWTANGRQMDGKSTGHIGIVFSFITQLTHYPGKLLLSIFVGQIIIFSVHCLPKGPSTVAISCDNQLLLMENSRVPPNHNIRARTRTHIMRINTSSGRKPCSWLFFHNVKLQEF
jgi:hypothetical protein